jgi:hypothetical protein
MNDDKVMYNLCFCATGKKLNHSIFTHFVSSPVAFSANDNQSKTKHIFESLTFHMKNSYKNFSIKNVSYKSNLNEILSYISFHVSKIYIKYCFVSIGMPAISMLKKVFDEFFMFEYKKVFYLSIAANYFYISLVPLK